MEVFYLIRYFQCHFLKNFNETDFWIKVEARTTQSLLKAVNMERILLS